MFRIWCGASGAPLYPRKNLYILFREAFKKSVKKNVFPLEVACNFGISHMQVSNAYMHGYWLHACFKLPYKARL